MAVVWWLGDFRQSVASLVEHCLEWGSEVPFSSSGIHKVCFDQGLFACKIIDGYTDSGC